MLTAERIFEEAATTSRMVGHAGALESVLDRVTRQAHISDEYRAVIGWHLGELLRLASELGIPVEVRA